MRKTRPMKSHYLFSQLWLSALLGLVMSGAHANSNNSTYSDAVFAANAVRTPVAQDDDDSYSSYRERYAELRATRQQKQKADEEQRAQDAQVSSIPRNNESDAEYQARMEKERNPIWLKHQAQAKLQAQIRAHQEEKQNQQAVGIASNNLPSVSMNNIHPSNSDSTGLTENLIASQTASLKALSFNPQTSELSPDSIPRAMTMGKYIDYSLFYLVGIAWCLIFFIGLMRGRKK